MSAYLHAELGQLDEAARQLDDLLAAGRLPFEYLEFGFADVVWTADILDRREPVRAALAATPARPASAAGCALLDGHPGRAADIYEAAGAMRSAALTRLRYGHAVGSEPLGQALAFFARVGASRYHQGAVGSRR